jgi:hypothetical protein
VESGAEPLVKPWAHGVGARPIERGTGEVAHLGGYSLAESLTGRSERRTGLDEVVDDQHWFFGQTARHESPGNRALSSPDPASSEGCRI